MFQKLVNYSTDKCWNGQGTTTTLVTYLSSLEGANSSGQKIIDK
jgi:hypothetical protein